MIWHNRWRRGCKNLLAMIGKRECSIPVRDVQLLTTFIYYISRTNINFVMFSDFIHVSSWIAAFHLHEALLKIISFHKGTEKPSTSFLSASSASASWPDQISPLEPSKDSISRETSGFDALGVRPREQRGTTAVTDGGSGNSSGRSTPVYHHYHHHFHHRQPQGRVPGMCS